MFHIFHRWKYCNLVLNTKRSKHPQTVRFRKCNICGTIQGYSSELKKWCDFDYLETTNLDNMIWNDPYITTHIHNPTFFLYNYCEVAA